MREVYSMLAFMYAELDFFSVILIINICVFAYWLFKRQGWTRPKQALIIVVLLSTAFITDAVEALGEYFGVFSPGFMYMINAIYFVSIVAAAASYFIYLYFRLKFLRRDKSTAIMLLSIPAIIVSVMSLSAINNKLLFYMNDENRYTRGPLYHLYTCAIILYYGTGLIMACIALRRDHKKTRKFKSEDTYIAVGLALYAASSLIFFLIQWVTQFNIYSMGATFSVFIFMTAMIYGQVGKTSKLGLKKDKQIEKMKVLLKEEREVKEFFLTGYFAAFYVDLDTHEYKVYICDDDKYKGSEDFFELTNKICEDFIASEDGLDILNLLTPEAIRKILSENKQHQIIVRSANKEGQHFVLMHIVAGEDENHAAIGFTDVDDLVKRRQQQQRILDQSHQVIEMLGGVVESRNMESSEHIKRVQSYTRILAESMLKKYPEYKLNMHKIELIVSASALHDVGKIMIKDEILLKPAKLTDKEFETIKEHSRLGSEIISKMMIGLDEEYRQYSYDISLYHHEKYDGSGYPEGLKGDQIPVSAQLVSMADCFDALTTKRVYKDAYSLDEAYEMILKGKCGAFSSKLLDCFISTREELFDTAERMRE